MRTFKRWCRHNRDGVYMYRKYNAETITKARKYRSMGLSLNEISHRLRRDSSTIPKGTIGNWVRDIILTDSQKNNLKSKQPIRRVGPKRDRIIRHKKWYLEGKNISLPEPSLVGLIIYACEGTHSVKHQGISLCNTDPALINQFLTMMNEIFDITLDAWKMRLVIHQYHNQDEVISYWIEKLKISNVIIQNVRSGGRRIRKNYMGCAHIQYNNIEIRCKLEGLIDKYTGRNYPIGEDKV